MATKQNKTKQKQAKRKKKGEKQIKSFKTIFVPSVTVRLHKLRKKKTLANSFFFLNNLSFCPLFTGFSEP